MSKEKGGADTKRFKMKPKPGAPPGLETDGQGNVIPLAQRVEEDRNAALAAQDPRDPSIKNPEGEAENPAPMPREQQGTSTRRE